MMFELPPQLAQLRSKVPVLSNQTIVNYRELAQTNIPDYSTIVAHQTARALAEKIAELFIPAVRVSNEWDHKKFFVRGVVLTEYDLNELLYHAYTIGQDSALRSRPNMEWMMK